MSAAPESVARTLELAATRVLEMRDEAFFVGENPARAVELSANPFIEIRKTGGTTGHRGQADDYIHYRFRIPALNIRYSIYVMPSTDDPARNQKALARAIRWFIPNFGGGSMFTRDEPAT